MEKTHSRDFFVSDSLLSIIWKNVTDRGREDSIRIQDVFVFISEMEKFLGVRNLLVKDEIRLLVKMMKEKSGLRLNREGLHTFLTKLVHMPSISEWLRRRGQVQTEKLSALLRTHELHHKPETQSWRKGTQDKIKQDTHNWEKKQRAQNQNMESRFHKKTDHVSSLDFQNRDIKQEFPNAEKGLDGEPSHTNEIWYKQDHQKPYSSLDDDMRPRSEVAVRSKETTPENKNTEPSEASTKSGRWAWVSGLWKPKTDKAKSGTSAQIQNPTRVKVEEDTRYLRFKSVVENQSKIIQNQEMLIQSLESRLYGGSRSFEIYSFLKTNWLTKRLPGIKNCNFNSIASTEMAAKIMLFMGASMAALATFILGVFLTLKIMRMLLLIFEAVTEHASEEDYSDGPLHFSWITEYPWIEYHLYNMYDAFGY